MRYINDFTKKKIGDSLLKLVEHSDITNADKNLRNLYAERDQIHHGRILKATYISDYSIRRGNEEKFRA